MMRTVAIALISVLGLSAFVFSSNDSRTPADARMDTGVEAEVEAAVLDYVEGIYNVQPDRIERSVSKDLVKYGYWRNSPDDAYRGSAMTYDQLHHLASNWNVDNHRDITDETPKEIVVLDVLDQTAAAKLTAYWGIDYFHLEIVDGKWMIRHVMWQAHPE